MVLPKSGRAVKKINRRVPRQPPKSEVEKKSSKERRLEAKHELMLKIGELNTQLAGLTSEVGHHREELKKMMLDDKDEKLEAIDGAVRVRASIIVPKPIVIDEAKLRKALGPEGWKRITSTVFDKNKMEALVAAKEIDANIVASAANEVPGNPQLRIT